MDIYNKSIQHTWFHHATWGSPKYKNEGVGEVLWHSLTEDGKVEFKEVTDLEPDSNLWIYIDRFDFEKKDVLVLIMHPRRWKPHYTKKLAEQLNETFKRKNILVMEDHPQLVEKVKDVVLNQGKYILMFCQNRTKLKTFADQLRQTDYYKNWSSKYEEEVTGSWRHPIKIEF